MDIGGRIEEFRKKYGLNQIQFSELCDIKQCYLSQIENNNKEPSLSVLKKIGNVMGIPLPILLFLTLEETDINKKYPDEDIRMASDLALKYAKKVMKKH